MLRTNANYLEQDIPLYGVLNCLMTYILYSNIYSMTMTMPMLVTMKET